MALRASGNAAMRSNRLKKFAIVSVPVVIAIGTGVALYAKHTPSSVFDADWEATAQSTALVERGQYLARASDCVACHSTPGGRPFEGGLAMETPMGKIFTTNITPDGETGIGEYTLGDFDRAMRRGVAKDGHRLYPAMPYPSYAKMSDEDIEALYAYFMDDVAPVKRANEESDIPWPLNMRWPLALWNAFFLDERVYEAKASSATEWNRGAYLVQGPGHCGSCHTPRGLAMNEKGLDETSEQFLSGAEIDGWFAPSLRGNGGGGIGTWSKEQIAQFLKTGRNEHAVVFGSMAEVVNNSTQHLTDQDLRSIATYLKSLPGEPGPYRAPEKAAPLSASAELDSRISTPGAVTFENKCSACHAKDGSGQSPWIPPLAGSSASNAKTAASTVNATLNGSARVVAQGIPDSYRMPAFRKQLTDKEIADVATYVRTSWGNKGGAVSESTVAKMRVHTTPASSEPIVLPLK